MAFEKTPPDYSGRITIGNNGDRKEVGTIKLWKTNYNDASRPLFQGFLIEDSDKTFKRVYLWNESVEAAPTQ
jgi:hypothetical protein